MATIYLNPRGEEITFAQWKNRIPSEYLLSRYEGKRIMASLEAANMVVDANLIPIPQQIRYETQFTNVIRTDAMGEELEKPRYVPDKDACGTYSTKEEAVKAYIDFLVRYDSADPKLFDALHEPAKYTEPPPIAVKDMELPIKKRPRSPDEDDDDDYSRDVTSPDEDGDSYEEKKVEAEPADKPPVGSDKPTEVDAIHDSIGYW